MKFALAGSLIALASVASAQLDNIPSCALTCFIGPLGSDGCTALTDFKCHCQKGAELLSKVQPCVQGACSAADQATTISAVEKTCKDAGVPINIPNASSAAASVASSAAASASSAAQVASSAAGAASSAVASATSSAAAVASSVASRLSSALASATGNGTASASPSATASQFTGGAPQATKAAALVGAAAIAMLAL